jgi:hypothetical protein
MRIIKFIGSTNSSYARGKDKKKRKNRGLLTTGALTLTGGAVGSRLAQTGIITKKMKKNFLKGAGRKMKLSEKIMSHVIANNVVNTTHNSSNAPKKIVKLFNKAKLRGGIKGSAIGAGVGLGGTLLVNKLKNRKKDK